MQKDAQSKKLQTIERGEERKKSIDNAKELYSKVIDIINTTKLKEKENPSMKTYAKKVGVDQRTLERAIILIKHIQSLPRLSIDVVETKHVSYVMEINSGAKPDARK